MKSIKMIFLLCVFFSFLGCGLSSEQQIAVDETVDLLRKIEAATQVGVNYQKYGELLIEAKAKVNDTQRLLPEGKLKKEINSTMIAYELAQEHWTISIETNTNSHEGIAQKYEAKEEMIKSWESAGEHLKKVSVLVD